MRAHAQQIAARNQTDDHVVAAPEDRRPADFDGGHAIGQLAHQLVFVSGDQLALGDQVTQRMAGRPARHRPAQRVGTRHHADQAAIGVDHRIALVAR